MGKSIIFESVKKWSAEYNKLERRQRNVIFFVLGGIILLILLVWKVNSRLDSLKAEITALKRQNSDVRQALMAEKSAYIELEQEFEPFKMLAKKQYPHMELQEGLSKLIDDFQISKRVVARYEYIPLASEKRRQIVSALQNYRYDFAKEDINIEVSCELWVSSEVKKLAEEIVSMLSEAELNVSGPKFNTLFDPQMPVYPVQWGYNLGQEYLFGQLYQALGNLITPSSKHTQDKTLPKGKITIHFAGHVEFDAAGMATIY
jgi:hypothetical protein